MPEFVNRAWGWFQTRPNIQKVLIVLAALVVLLLLSRAVAGIAALICLAALIALVVQWMRRRPVRGWGDRANNSAPYRRSETWQNAFAY